MSVLKYCAVLTAGLAALTSAAAQSPMKGDSVTVMDFQPADGPPKEVAANYTSLLNDIKITGAPNPKFFVNYSTDLNHNIELFVRVDSPLTCSASGECQIDFFAIDNPNVEHTNSATHLFSVIANNIAKDDRRAEPYANGRTLPLLLTNVIIEDKKIQTPRSKTDSTTLVGVSQFEASSFGGVWAWDGNGYRAVN